MISGALFFLLPLNYTRTASPVESFCHNGLVRRQFLEEFRVRLDGCQYLRRQSGRVTASGFPALDGVEAGSQHFRHLALRYVQLCPDGFHVCQLVTGDAAGSLTPFLISTASSSDAFSSSKTHVTPRLSVVGSASSARLFPRPSGCLWCFSGRPSPDTSPRRWPESKSPSRCRFFPVARRHPDFAQPAGFLNEIAFVRRLNQRLLQLPEFFIRGDCFI